MAIATSFDKHCSIRGLFDKRRLVALSSLRYFSIRYEFQISPFSGRLKTPIRSLLVASLPNIPADAALISFVLTYTADLFCADILALIGHTRLRLTRAGGCRA